jgi:cation transport regulator ChaB
MGIVRPDHNGDTMPYVSNDTLPSSVRRHLPQAAQSLYREGVAWAVVKGQFHKEEDGDWRPDRG